MGAALGDDVIISNSIEILGDAQPRQGCNQGLLKRTLEGLDETLQSACYAIVPRGILIKPAHQDAATHGYAQAKKTVWELRPPRKQQQHTQEMVAPLSGLELSG